MDVEQILLGSRKIGHALKIPFTSPHGTKTKQKKSSGIVQIQKKQSAHGASCSPEDIKTVQTAAASLCKASSTHKLAFHRRSTAISELMTVDELNPLGC